MLTSDGNNKRLNVTAVLKTDSILGFFFAIKKEKFNADTIFIEILLLEIILNFFYKIMPIFEEYSCCLKNGHHS